MNKLKLFKDNKASRSNSVDSVIKVAKEVTEQYFKTSNILTCYQTTKNMHEVNAVRKAVMT
jgi:hypothetical protein